MFPRGQLGFPGFNWLWKNDTKQKESDPFYVYIQHNFTILAKSKVEGLSMFSTLMPPHACSIMYIYCHLTFYLLASGRSLASWRTGGAMEMRGVWGGGAPLCFGLHAVLCGALQRWNIAYCPLKLKGLNCLFPNLDGGVLFPQPCFLRQAEPFRKIIHGQ